MMNGDRATAVEPVRARAARPRRRERDGRVAQLDHEARADRAQERRPDLTVIAPVNQPSEGYVVYGTRGARPPGRRLDANA